MPNNGKKNENDEGELDSSYADLLDDNSGLLSSLISDSKLRTPMDLIQVNISLFFTFTICHLAP